MKDIVFLGPSLPLVRAREICPTADYRAPVQMGDVLRAANERPRSITIIDGFFEQVPAVWHKEILHALDQGIVVLGGSSMGALRAAELDAFGMRGIGKIYQGFASGELTDDDEVAVVHAAAEDGYRNGSVAMASIRAALATACGEGVISADQAAALVAAEKARFYPERNWDALLEDARNLDLPAATISALAEFLQREQPDQKRDDAIATLEALRQIQQGGARPARVDFTFEHTVYWETVQTYCGQQGNQASEASFERIRNHARLFSSQRDQLREQGLLLFLVQQEARRLGLKQRDDREALTRFRARRGLHSPAALAEWLEQQRCSKEECLALARLEALISDLGMRHVAAVDQQLNSVLKLAGEYGAMNDYVSAKWQRLAQLNIGKISEQDVDSFDDVLAWYQSEYGRITTALEQHAQQLGIASLHQWREEAFAEYLWRQERGRLERARDAAMADASGGAESASAPR